MLAVYVSRGAALERKEVNGDAKLPDNALWIDLELPTPTEDKTATLMAHQDTEVPSTTPVTFILAGHRLITVRYEEPRPFVIVNHRLERFCPVNATGESIMLDILDAVIDRLADVLEHMGNDVEQVSRDIFDPKASPGDFRNYSRILNTI